MYSVHFEPLTDHRHPGERAIAWIARMYKDSPMATQAFRDRRDYVGTVTIHRSCLDVAEIKGLITTPTPEQFRVLMRGMYSLGIQIAEIRRAGKSGVDVYETKDFIR